jgi:exodeoxyribonuclease VII large subunit
MCDLAADVRAATPSQAAEFAVPDVQNIMSELKQAEYRAIRVVQNNLELYSRHLDHMCNHYLMKQPEIMLEKAYDALTDIDDSLTLCVENIIKEKQTELSRIAGFLDGVSPLKVLARGYGVISDKDGKSVMDSSELKVGQSLSARFHKGCASVVVTEVQNEG